MIKFIKSIFIKEIKLSELSTNELLTMVESLNVQLSVLGGLDHAWNNEKSNAFKCYLNLVNVLEELCDTYKHGEIAYRKAMVSVRINHPNFNY